MIDESDYEFVRDLLDDDESLNEAVMREITNSRKAMKDVLMGLRVLHRLQSCHTRISYAPWSELYIQAMSGSLLQSAIFNDILNSIKKLPSNTMDNVLSLPAAIPSPSSDFVLDLTAIKTDLKQITGSMDPNALPLRSAYDIQNSALRTTVVAQKVSLSMSSAKMSSQDNAYTKIVDRTYNALLKYFQTTLINPSDLFLSEILIYDSKSPLRDAFTPRPRFAIERALSSPHDYLGCECCSSGEGAGLQSSPPATAILYQLYLESGSVINTADLWEAFWTITGGEDDDGERSEALALFSRALAELKYMGMIKNSRKKADHLQKLAWKGL